MSKKEKLITSDEAAKMLGYHPAHMRNMRVQDIGPSYYKIGPGKNARVMYSIDELKRYELSLNRMTKVSTKGYSNK